MSVKATERFFLPDEEDTYMSYEEEDMSQTEMRQNDGVEDLLL